MPATIARAPKLLYPRPPLVHDHAALFQEPSYEGGEPYAVDDEDDEPAPTITA